MENLSHIQRRVSSLVMQPRLRWGKEIAQLIAPNDRLSSLERLRIYHEQYWARLLTSFEEDFAGLQAVLGKRKFQAVVRAYLTACPSTSFTLRNLGSRLASWAEANRLSFAPFAELALDMIRLEWAHIEVFDAPSSPPIQSPGVPFTLQPYVRLLTVQHAVDDLLLEVRAADVRQLPRKRIAQYANKKCALHIAVHRWDNSVYYKTLELGAHTLLSAIASGHSLDVAVNLLPASIQIEKVQELFADWAGSGWLCARE